MDERLCRFLAQRPEFQFVYPDEAQVHAYPSPRSWAFADRALRKFSADPELLGPALSACVGELAANTFLDWLARPDLDLDALLAQEHPRLPEDADGRWALLDAAIARAGRLDVEDAQQASRLLRLAAAFEPELGGIKIALVGRLAGQQQNSFSTPKGNRRKRQHTRIGR